MGAKASGRRATPYHGMTSALFSINRRQMNESKTQNYICVAAIAGAFGVKGEVKVKSFTQEPENCLSYGPLLSEDGAVVITPKNSRPIKDGFAVFAEEVSTREEAEALKSTKLYVARESLPEPDEDEFYYADLEGLQVKTTDGKLAGHILGVHEFGAGDMLEIKPKEGASFFHPFTKAATPKVDIKAGRVIIDLKAVEPEAD